MQAILHGQGLGSRRTEMRKAIRERKAENKQGRAYGCATHHAPENAQGIEVAGSERNPPMTGPIRNPSPNEAPMRPIRFGICEGVLMSPIEARATATVPFPAPARNRAMSATHKLPVIPNITKNTELLTMPNIMIGRRPRRSERAPNSGEQELSETVGGEGDPDPEIDGRSFESRT